MTFFSLVQTADGWQRVALLISFIALQRRLGLVSRMNCLGLVSCMSGFSVVQQLRVAQLFVLLDKLV